MSTVFLRERRLKMDGEAFVKTQQAAHAVGLDKSFLYRNWKTIPAARRAGRALRWDVSALKRWMATQASPGSNDREAHAKNHSTQELEGSVA
jgi:predicted DNA-binding transcriptional regulator AlpA